MLNRILNGLVSERIRQNPLRFSYAKNILGAIVITLFAAPLYACMYYVLGFVDAAYIILLEGVIVVSSIIFLKTMSSTTWARQVIVGSLIICIAWLSYRLGGIYTPVAFWLVLPPLLANFFGGIRSSFYWSATCLLVAILLYVHPSLMIDPQKIHYLNSLQIISISGLVVIMLVLSYFFETGKRHALKEMASAHLQLKSQRTKLAVFEKVEEINILLTNILESSIEYSIVATDLNGSILTWNTGAQHIYGYTADEMIGKRNLSDLFMPAEIQNGSCKEMLEKVLKEERAEGDFERIRKNGEHFCAEIDISLRKDSDNNPIGFLLISKDITEKKQLEEQLLINKELDLQNRQIHETSRLKSSFLANMSHELRTPMTAILGFSELMQSQELGQITEEQREALRDMIISGKDLLRLIDSLLDLSKIELGKLEFHPQIIDLQTLVNSVLSILRPLFDKKQISCYVEIDPTLDNILNDPTRLKQILYNYLSNAIKFTDVAGEVHLKIFNENKDMFRIEITDNGIGIATENLAKLFVEFQQLDNGIAKQYAGTGLGLALVKHIVEAQNGKVGVTSKLGIGSTFFAVIPKIYDEHLNQAKDHKSISDFTKG